MSKVNVTKVAEIDGVWHKLVANPLGYHHWIPCKKSHRDVADKLKKDADRGIFKSHSVAVDHLLDLVDEILPDDFISYLRREAEAVGGHHVGIGRVFKADGDVVKISVHMSFSLENSLYSPVGISKTRVSWLGADDGDGSGNHLDVNALRASECRGSCVDFNSEELMSWLDEESGYACYGFAEHSMIRDVMADEASCISHRAGHGHRIAAGLVAGGEADVNLVGNGVPGEAEAGGAGEGERAAGGDGGQGALVIRRILMTSGMSLSHGQRAW